MLYDHPNYRTFYRVIEVSMWGNIAVEETVDVRHNGAVLKVRKRFTGENVK
jgi:hypothetical protein